jgi:hypothetical protein
MTVSQTFNPPRGSVAALVVLSFGFPTAIAKRKQYDRLNVEQQSL